MSKLLQTLSAELERPRIVSSQVAKHIADTHGVEREKLGSFLVNELPALEDYEIDLILSPLFTPTLQEQSVFAELLGRESVPAANWPGLVQQLAARPTRAHLVTEDDAVHILPLREVSIERVVHRLRLDATIPGHVFEQIEQCREGVDRALLKAVARRAVWENEKRREILKSAIESFTQHPDDLAALLKLVETYLPTDVRDLLGHIPNWKQIVRQEINDAGSKPFFNERVHDLHGGGRDQRRQDNTRVSVLEKEFQFLERLEKLLAQNPPQPA